MYGYDLLFFITTTPHTIITTTPHTHHRHHHTTIIPSTRAGHRGRARLHAGEADRAPPPFAGFPSWQPGRPRLHAVEADRRPAVLLPLRTLLLNDHTPTIVQPLITP